jgi:hypothetical protein
MAAMIRRFGWSRNNYQILANAAAATKILAAGTEACGGNSQVDWQTIPDPAHIGSPILEAEPEGPFVITKHPGTGGSINRHTLAGVLLAGVGDPSAWQTPEVTVDLSEVRLEECGPERVRVTGARGSAPAKPRSREAIQPVWQAVAEILYCWPAPLEKAYAADRILRERVAGLDVVLEEIHSEFVGVNAAHGPAAPPQPDYPEVVLRITVRGARKEDVERAAREIAPLVWCGPPSGVILRHPGSPLPEFAAARGGTTGAAPAPVPAVMKTVRPAGGRVPLSHLAHTRSAPLGGGANIAVLAWSEEEFAALRRQLPAAEVQSYLGALVSGQVERYEAPGLHALNFVLPALRAGAHVNAVGASLLRISLYINPVNQ